MKRMLINATQPEEIRLAMVDGQKLLNFEIEQFGREQRKGNIYKAVITRIEPSLEACFVDYGEERQGFLPFKEISRQYFATSDTPIGQIKINDALEVGQELVVQVEKEERGNKNAALTTFISLAGRYLVLMPNKPRSGGVSRRIEGNERQELRDAMNELSHPRGMSLIARTAGIGRAVNELRWDLDYLLGLWKAISDAAEANKGAFLIYNESALVIRAIRDYYTSDVSEVLIDTDGFYNQAQQFMTHIMPDDAQKVKHYQDETALFARFQIEKQIESAYAREVKLPSGGSIVLDHTEALVAVDVNSAKATRGSDIEETATNTNLEAADEIARQLRLRDLGGLIVIDFIDMEGSKNRQDVENRLRQALKQDRARVQFATISRFGLLELSRQRLRPALFEGASISCPRCNGTGHIRDTESTALQILRRIQEEAQKENTAAIQIQVPVDVASYLLNKKREEITKIEIYNNINVVLIPNMRLETPNYQLERLKADDPQLEALQNTYTLGDRFEDSDAVISKAEQKANRQEPVIKNFLPETAPAPKPEQEKRTKTPALAKEEKTASTGFWGWLKSLFGSDTEDDKKTTQDKKDTSPKSTPTGGQEERRSNDRKRGNRDRDERNRGASGRSNERSKEKAEQAERPERRRGTRTNDARANESNRDNQQRDQRENAPRNSRRNNKADHAEVTEEVQAPNRRTQRREQPRNDDRNNKATEVENQAQAQQTAQQGNEQNGEQQEQSNRRSKNNRRERHPRQKEERQDAVQEASVQIEQTEDAQVGQEEQAAPRARRTRDRYGRDRRQRNTRHEEAGDKPFVENAATDMEQAPSAEQPRSNRQEKRQDDAAQAPTNNQQDETIEKQTTENHGRRNADRTPRKTQEQKAKGQQQEPARTEKDNATVGTDYTLPESHLEEMTQKAGLEWVETNPVLAKEAQGAQATLFAESNKTSPASAEQQTQGQQQSKAPKHRAAAAVDYALPKDDLESIAQKAGLQWVGTDSLRVKEVQEAIRNEPKVTLGREIKSSATVENEPLVMVETQKKIV